MPSRFPAKRNGMNDIWLIKPTKVKKLWAVICGKKKIIHNIAVPCYTQKTNRNKEKDPDITYDA